MLLIPSGMWSGPIPKWDSVRGTQISQESRKVSPKKVAGRTLVVVDCRCRSLSSGCVYENIYGFFAVTYQLCGIAGIVVGMTG